jgi:hypothetical protein
MQWGTALVSLRYNPILEICTDRLVFSVSFTRRTQKNSKLFSAIDRLALGIKGQTFILTAKVRSQLCRKTHPELGKECCRAVG